MITKPGLYADIDENDYHADRLLSPELGHSLSASGAKVLLNKTGAHYQHQRETPSPSSDSMDLGSVAHHLILHRGGRLLVVDAYDWKKPANQALRKAERAKGTVVVHRGELRAAARMARAVRQHPLASRILTDGTPEVSLWWTDPDTGVTMRGRIDWLRGPLDQPTHIVDLKTARDAGPRAFAKAAADYGYRESLANYRRGIQILTGLSLPVVIVVVESAPPHAVAVYTLTLDDLAWGEERMDKAIRLYAECESAGEWPGYSTDIEVLNFPNWAY